MAQEASPKKITVVGGSAAGLHSAALLARAGARVDVLEQSEHLDPLHRTLIVTSRMRDILGAVGEPCIVNEIHRFELFTDGRVAKIQLARPDLVIERAALIRSLALEAQAAGAILRFGKRFKSLQSANGQIRVCVESSSGPDKTFDSSAVIGADGAASKVAAAAGWPKLATVPLIQAIVTTPDDYPPATVRLWFIPEDTRYFFWLIPEAGGKAALGLIGEDGATARRALERFMEKKHFDPLSYQAARIPVYTRWVPAARNFGGGHVYLAGDSAAHVKVTTVGGIVTGLRGAAGVAESILNGGRSKILRKLRRELDTHLLIRRALHHFQQPDYSRLVDLLNSGALESLATHTRDEAARVLWHICRHQPRFALLGLRGLLTGGPLVSPARP